MYTGQGRAQGNTPVHLSPFPSRGPVVDPGGLAPHAASTGNIKQYTPYFGLDVGTHTHALAQRVAAFECDTAQGLRCFRRGEERKMTLR